MGTGLSPLASCPGCGFENPSSFRFCGQCGARLDLAPPSAERRQLTVLFCDVVDSATLAERLDPEELRDVLTSYHAMCGTVIARFGGHTAQVLGDGLLIYFGYPAAHEDDAGRAVHTALGIVEGTRALDERLMRERGLSFAIRCGIHTGAVVAGDLSVGESRERLAIGQTPNIAARLQALAAPGTILVSGASHQLSAGAFECEPLGARTLKGIERPIDVYRVLAEAGAGRAPRPDGRGAPIVGREEQLAALERAFGGAAAGTGQAVLVLGEAGVGKSRLLQAFQTSLAAAPHRLLTCQGSPFDRTSALHPLITMLRRAFELDRPDTAPARHARLREILARLDVSHEHADALLANLLFADPGAAAAPALEHHEQKQRTLDLLIAIVGRMAGDGPAILVMEDMHHADPSTLELLALTVTRLPGMPVLLLMTARPSFVPPWPAEAPVTRLTVDRLDDAQIATLIERVAQNRSLPGELRRQLIERADGVPLFAEELTKAVLESGLLEVRGDRLELAGPLPPLAVPATLQDSLTARLDRLGDAREVAQVAAVIGREFRYEMLRRVYARDEARLLDGLARLEQAEIVVARGTEPAGVYVFKHALLQAAAYALLLKAARRAYHQRVAETLVASFPDEAAAQPELVAHHFSEADAASPAIAYWLQAAERAWQRSADQESVEGLTRALALLPRLPESERDPAELAIQMKLGRALTAMRGYTFGEVERAYSRALELSKALGDALQGFFALDGLHSLHAVRGDMPRIRRISERMLKRARTLGDPALLIAAHYKAGAHHFFGGDFEGARSHYQHAVELSTRHSIERFTTPERADIISRTLLGGALWFLGYPDRARQVCVEAIALAREASHPQSVVGALVMATKWTFINRGDYGEAWAHLNEALAICGHHALPWWQAIATMTRAGLVACGRAPDGEGEAPVEGAAAMHAVIQALRGAGTQIGVPDWQKELADALLWQRRVPETIAAIDAGLAVSALTEQGIFDAELHRLRGEAARLEGGSEEAGAERWFQAALETAHRQGARSLELRAAMSLAALRETRAGRAEARRVLEGVYAGFTEGFETADLRAARAMLARLA